MTAVTHRPLPFDEEQNFRSMIIATAFSNESSLPFTYLFASHNLSFSMGSERAPQPFPHPAHRGCDDSRAQLASGGRLKPRAATRGLRTAGAVAPPPRSRHIAASMEIELFNAGQL